MHINGIQMQKKLLKIGEPEKSSNQILFETNGKHCMRIISDLTPKKAVMMMDIYKDISIKSRTFPL